MARPTKNSIMKRHVLSPKYMPFLDFAVFMIKSNIVKVIIASALIYIIRIFYLAEAINYFKLDYPLEYQQTFEDRTMNKPYSEQIKYILYSQFYALQKQHPYWVLTFELEHKFNFAFLLVILCYLCIGYESQKFTLFHKFTRNTVFKVVLLL